MAERVERLAKKLHLEVEVVTDVSSLECKKAASKREQSTSSLDAMPSYSGLRNAKQRAKGFYFLEADLTAYYTRLDNGLTSPLRHAAPLFGRAAVGYDNKRFAVEAFTHFQGECSADDMPDEEKEKAEFYALDAAGNAYSPAWITLNIRASYKMAEALTVNASLENIADRRYRPYSSGISAAGRNFTVSLNYSLF